MYKDYLFLNTPINMPENNIIPVPFYAPFYK